jgi:hypothetical protein
MLYKWLRAIRSVAGALTDKSLDNQAEGGVLLDLTATVDYIYLGQTFPFNNFYIQSKVANDVSATIKVEYWDGSAWRQMVDVLDGTSVGGKPLAQSGLIQFSPDIHYMWCYVPDTSESAGPSELQTLTIYNLYWLRISYSSTLKATTAAQQFTYAFSTHNRIAKHDTTISNYLTSFEAGKTSWESEIITASQEVIKELQSRKLILHPGQILRLDDVSLAAEYKTLSNIYFNIGGEVYNKKKETIDKKYEGAMDISGFTLDLNKNGFVDREEMEVFQFRAVRS